MLPNALRNQLVSTLLNIPKIENRNRRDELLLNIPSNIVLGLPRDEGARTDLSLVVSQLDKLGRLLSTGERPLIMVAQAGMPYVEGTEAGRKLVGLVAALENYYGSSEALAPIVITPTPSQTAATRLVPEAVIFTDERVPYAFVERAFATAASVARLMVPRLIGGAWAEGRVTGTAWMVAPELPGLSG